MLSIRPTVTGVELDNSGFTVKDLTGVYSTPNNEGGYGAPNPEYEDFTHASIDLQLQGKTARETIQGLTDLIDELQNGSKITWSFCDGVYTVKLWMGKTVELSGDFDISVANLITPTVTTLLALSEGYTHVSVLEDPYARREVVEVNANQIVLATPLPEGLVAAQDGIIYWWSGETHTLSMNKAGLKLAKRLSYRHCECKEEMEWYCMLMRIDALYSLGDYSGAQELATYLKDRLC